MNRRFISYLLILVVVASLSFLSSCGEKTEIKTEEGTALELVVSYIDAMKAGDFEKVLEMMAEEGDIGDVYLSRYFPAPTTELNMIESQNLFLVHFYEDDAYDRIEYRFSKESEESEDTIVDFYFPDLPLVHLLGYKDIHMVVGLEDNKWVIKKGLSWTQDQYADYPKPDYYRAVEASYGIVNMTSTAQDVLNYFGDPMMMDIPEISTGEEEFREYTIMYPNVTFYFVPGGDFVETRDRYIISSLITGDRTYQMNRGIRVGDSFYDVMKKFPIDKDWISDPNNCFYGENTYDSFGGACFSSEADGSIYDTVVLVPLEYTPYIKYDFIDKQMVSAMIVFISLF